MRGDCSREPPAVTVRTRRAFFTDPKRSIGSWWRGAPSPRSRQQIPNPLDAEPLQRVGTVRVIGASPHARHKCLRALSCAWSQIARFLPPPKHGGSRTQTRGTRRFRSGLRPSFEGGGQESHQEHKEEER